MALVLLIRHATTEATGRILTGWSEGHPLDDHGHAQAEALARRMAGFRLAAVYSSPLERCAQTAEAIAAPHRLHVTMEDDLGEVRYGDWTGRPLRVLARTKLWRQLMRAPSQTRFPNGETLAEVQVRAVSAVNAIAARHAGKTVAVCSHADVIRLLLAHYSGVHVDMFQRTAVSPASLSAVVLEGATPRILRVNDTGTLEDLTVAKPPPRKPAPRRGVGG
ncbi:MAG: MSMEG_4193 family putative phosphomutase [Actinomycetota bacterium]